MISERLESRVLLTADLQSGQLTPPATAAAGDQITVDWEVVNAGLTNAPAFDVEFYLSDNSSFDPGDLLLGSVTVPGVNANNGSSGVQQISVTLPDAGNPIWIGDGQYHVISWIDSTLEIPESNEDNNFPSAPFTVTGTGPNQPDLTGSVTPPTPADAGTTVSFAWDVENIGPVASDAFAVEFYLTKDPFIAPDSVSFHTANIGPLSPNGGATGEASRSFLLPGVGDSFWEGDGQYYVTMVVDLNDVVAEGREDNNVIAGAFQVNNTQAQLPDLTDQTFSAPLSGVAGNDVTIDYEVINQGPVAAGPFDVTIYISRDPGLAPDSVVLTTINVAGLAADTGTTGPQSVDVTLPVPTDFFWDGNGDYFLVMAIDDFNAVDEATESNNVVTQTINVVGIDGPVTSSLDVDANNSVSLFTDGILIVRHLAGFTGTALTDGALGNGATRTNPADITAFLNAAATGMLDVDGNGNADIFTDGILIARYMAGFRGAALTDGALGNGATRTDPAAIVAFLDTFLPTPPPDTLDGTLSAAPPSDGAADSGDDAAAPQPIAATGATGLTSDSSDAAPVSNPRRPGAGNTIADSSRSSSIDLVLSNLLDLEDELDAI